MCLRNKTLLVCILRQYNDEFEISVKTAQTCILVWD